MTSARRVSRDLTDAERAALSPGLLRALEAAGAEARLVAAAHPAARIAALWRGGVPILARARAVYWPGLPEDLAGRGPWAMATLQHELQHLLDYATGRLSGARYLLDPRHWRYSYRLTPDSAWDDFGAEQRASIAEHYWLLEQGRGDLVPRARDGAGPEIGLYRRVIPWAER